MSPYIARRLVAAIPTLLGVSFVVFLMVRLLPGDPAVIIAGPFASPEVIALIRAQLGLDQPAVVQYGMFLGRLAQFDLGVSARTSQPVASEIVARLPSTVQLAISSSLLATTTGIITGVLAARHHNQRLDYAISAIMTFGLSMPVYWLGLMLIVIFSVQLQLLPAAGSQDTGAWIMPTVTLAAYSVALITRMTRSSMLEVMSKDYVRTARAKGLAERGVVYGHALRNVLLPVLTVVGLQFGHLLGGAVLTETVFGWPGLGRLMVESLSSRDYPMIQGIVLTFATSFIVVNLLVDLLYIYVDPRLRYT